MSVGAIPKAAAWVATNDGCCVLSQDTERHIVLEVIYHRLGKHGSSSMPSKLSKWIDFLLKDSNQYGSKLADRLIGPVAGSDVVC
mmetsp:Transcript_38505/g.57252  ORF Transcript_38505/g.57252 Transcript_38505/m.57252 type:complete len:85 (-) Transcript_38505:365-619(-)